MGMFLNDEQEKLAHGIAAQLIARDETVAVAEGTAGGLISAALLSVAGASRYYAGGGVVYTLGSRTALAGVPPEQYANYQGTTPEMLTSLAESMRERLGATRRPGGKHGRIHDPQPALPKQRHPRSQGIAAP